MKLHNLNLYTLHCVKEKEKCIILQTFHLTQNVGNMETSWNCISAEAKGFSVSLTCVTDQMDISLKKTVYIVCSYVKFSGKEAEQCYYFKQKVVLLCFLF